MKRATIKSLSTQSSCYLTLCLLLFILSFQAVADSNPGLWLLIDTEQEQLFIKYNKTTLKVFENIAIGRGGKAKRRIRDDGKTPLGDFEIAWISPKSQYHMFFGLNYPNLERIETAYRVGEIDRRTYYKVWDALAAGEVPPQDTQLGGHLGIHGLGGKSPEVHQRYNWTQGCIALTNPQIEELASWVTIGTKVIIR